VHLPFVSSYTAIDMPAAKEFFVHDKAAISRANSGGHEYLHNQLEQPNLATNVHH
jgi:hypothetical protein